MKKILKGKKDESDIIYIDDVEEDQSSIYAYYVKSSMSGIRILCRIEDRYKWTDLTIGNVNCGIINTQGNLKEALQYGHSVNSGFGMVELDNICELKDWANKMQRKIEGKTGI